MILSGACTRKLRGLRIIAQWCEYSARFMSRLTVDKLIKRKTHQGNFRWKKRDIVDKYRVHIE